MSDSYADEMKKEATPPSPLPEGRSVVRSITLHPNGQVEFSLPNNFVLAHGLLGMAATKLTELQLLAAAKQPSVNGNGWGGLLKRATGRG